MIMRYFTHDLPALKIAALSDISRPTINQRFFKIRPRIAQLCDASSPFSGEVEGDESSLGKTIVFGILERQGKVYTEIVPDASKKPLQAVIRGQVSHSIIHPDGWRGYNGLVDMGYQKHLRVHP